MRRIFGGGLGASVGLVVGLLVLNAVLAYRNTRQLDHDARWVAHTHEVLDGLGHLRSTLEEAEAGQRGYLITHERRYLEPLDSAATAAQGQLDRLQELTRDNTDQQKRFPRLRELVTDLLSELQRAVTLGTIETAAGKQAKEAARATIGEMEQVERDLLRQRENTTEGAYQVAIASGLATAVLGLAAVGGFAWLVRRSLRASANAAAVLQQERERFRVTLASIGDGVIVTDDKERVTFLNAVAGTLTGWDEKALGKGLPEVFPIFSEETGERIESPAARVIREGVVVGLANHTILVARDGTRRPIDDSGAPVRDDRGEMVGVVLVFRDVTARRQAEAELRASEEQFHSLADSIPQLAWMARPDGHIFWYNRRWYDYTGTTPEQMEGWGWQSVHDPVELPRVLVNWKAALETGVPWEDTFPLRRHDGQLRWHLSRAFPVRDDQGRVARWFGTNTDISERFELERALRDADQKKDAFLAMLAHELRNPLVPLRNGLQVLKLLDSDGGTVEKSRTMMERQLGHLTRIVDDLLDVSRITRGKVGLRKERLDLGRLVRQVTEDERFDFPKAGLALEVQVPELPVWALGDATRLTQLLANLLQNALKFTDRGGQVSVSVHVEVEQRVAVLTVRDTGIGIELEVLPHLFQSFNQADRSLDRSRGGLGLGLSLVKGLAELHGGEVRASSAGPGRGAEFTVRLPVEPEPAALSETSAQPQPTGQQLRVLVVEDNRDAAESLRLLLELYGYEVAVAHSGPEGVVLAQEWRPNVVLCDIGLPGLDGYGVAEELRRNPATANIRLIAVTGYGSEDDRRRSRAAGFDRHMVKPVDPAALQKVLSETGTSKA